MKQSPQILIVDSNPNDVQVVRAVLEQAGMGIHVRTDASSAVEAFHAIQPDLVLIDARVPETNGVQISRELKQTDLGRATPIILMSREHLDARKLSQALKTSGCALLLQKPVMAADLIDTMSRFLPNAFLSGHATEEPGDTRAGGEVTSDFFTPSEEATPADTPSFDADTLGVLLDQVFPSSDAGDLAGAITARAHRQGEPATQSPPRAPGPGQPADARPIAAKSILPSEDIFAAALDAMLPDDTLPWSVITDRLGVEPPAVDPQPAEQSDPDPPLQAAVADRADQGRKGAAREFSVALRPVRDAATDARQTQASPGTDAGEQVVSEIPAPQAPNETHAASDGDQIPAAPLTEARHPALSTSAAIEPERPPEQSETLSPRDRGDDTASNDEVLPPVPEFEPRTAELAAGAESPAWDEAPPAPPVADGASMGAESPASHEAPPQPPVAEVVSLGAEEPRTDSAREDPHGRRKSRESKRKKQKAKKEFSLTEARPDLMDLPKRHDEPSYTEVPPDIDPAPLTRMPRAAYGEHPPQTIDIQPQDVTVTVETTSEAEAAPSVRKSGAARASLLILAAIVVLAAVVAGYLVLRH